MIMPRTTLGLLTAVAVAVLAVPPASAQEGRFGSAISGPDSPLTAGGWNITPSLLYGASWDDNVLLKGRGDEPRADFLNVLNPRVDASMIGRKGRFSGSYDGAFVLYHDLNTLNSYDQHGEVAAKRLLSKHVTMFVTDSFAFSPTTELSLLVGVPFVRTGARVNDFRTGIEADLTKRTSITASYDFGWVRFDDEPVFDARLLGGESHTGTLLVRHKRTEHTALTLEYGRQLSMVGGGSEHFDAQSVAAGFERTVNNELRIFAAGGFSRIGESAFAPGQTSPRYRAGLNHRLRAGSLDVLYDRSYAPAFGLGGMTETKEFAVRLHMPLVRRLYTQSSLSWRTNSYLQLADTDMRSRWFEGSIGYLAQPWMRIEGFFGIAYQTSSVPGTTYDRNRYGVQVVTAKPVRIR
jgi:hypothetical protein